MTEPEEEEEEEEEGLVQRLGWDSDFWGVEAARVHARTTDELHLAAAECEARGVDWASLLVPSEDVGLLTAAVRDGYDIVDIRYCMSCSVADRRGVNQEGAHQRSLDRRGADDESVARPEEIDVLSSIARTSLRRSRFFSDRRLPDERCEFFYETWLRNSMGGPMADATLVERGPEGPDGFITVRLDARSASASLPLVAVKPLRQGLGVGRRLLSVTLDWIAAQGANDVSVITQLSNLAAIRLYQSGGFTLQESAVWLHRWFLDPDVE